MDTQEITNTLVHLTGSWVPAGSSSEHDLEEARLVLARALSSGVEPQSLNALPLAISQPAAADRQAIEMLVQKASAKAELTLLPRVRTASIVDPAAFALTSGMQVSKTLGPFVDLHGTEYWIDLIPLPKKIPISSATRGVLAYLVMNRLKPTLGAGSIWVVEGAFNTTPILNGMVGLSFSAGTSAHTGSVTVTNTSVVIDTGGVLMLTLTLAPPAPPAGLPGVGLDAAQMSLSLPKTVTLEITAAGATFKAVADSAATVYGTNFSVKRSSSAPRIVSVGINYLTFPCLASLTHFQFLSVLSTDVMPSGQAAISHAGWALPILNVPPGQLGAASSAGGLVVELGGGAGLKFGSLVSPALLAGLVLALEPGGILLSATNGARDLADRLMLWEPAPPPVEVVPAPAQRASEIDVTVLRGTNLFGLVSTQFEALIASGKARINADRPLAADGSRLPLAFAQAQIIYVHAAASGVSATLSVPDYPPNTPLPQSVIVLENALLKVGPAQTASLQALYAGVNLVGSLALTFQNMQLLPILPDPYASAFAAQQQLPGTLTALDTWTRQPGAALSFVLTPSTSAAAGAPAGQFSRQRIPADVSRSALTLLDLSSNADQFGVSFIFSEYLPYAAALDGMALAVPQELMQVYALPGISWEPVVDQSTKNWLDAASPDDGTPTTLAVNTVNLVRVEPNVALPAFVQAAAKADTNAFFTLPFGLTANLQMTANDPPDQRPAYSFIQADYAHNLSAARQLVIEALAAIHIGDPALPGSATTGSTLPVPLNSTVYGVLALGNDPLGAAQFFDQQFSEGGVYPEVPVTRIDISGYGTSMFSDWKNQDLGFVGVVRSRFEVLIGRTSYELVQIASLICPWCIRMTRTIIFDRFSTGLVVRHDSGWKATGTGKFELLQADQQLPGAVDHLQNIHNIVVGSGANITLVPPDVSRTLEFVPVTFDADVVMIPAVTAQTNGSSTPIVAATQIQGYAQLTVGPVATADEILKLMQKVPNGVSGTLGCILNVGSAPGPAAPRFTLSVSSLTAKVTRANVAGQGYPALAVALNGAPRLPRDGAWSIARRGSGDQTPTPVDPNFPVPLIFATNNDNTPQWRLLDPADGLSAFSPNTFYGLLQGTGTSKSLIENPVIDSSGGSLLLDPNRGVPAPNLADLGSLLGASGIFPNLANVLRIPTGPADVLNLAQDGFQKTFDWTVEKPDHSFLDDQSLLDVGVISLNLQYHGPDSNHNDVATHATFTVDANPPAGSPRWSLALDHLSQAVFVQGFGSDALLTIHGGFFASETQKAGFNNIQVDYGSALSLVKSIISGLTTLIEAMGGSVNLDVGFSDNKLTVDDGFALPTIPLGLGEIEDIAIDLGLQISIPDHADFHVELGTQDKPFTWIVDPLAGTGAIVLGTTDGKLGVMIEAGIGAALAIDLAIASGSASIILELAISTSQTPFALTATLVGNASVDVLDGLASVSLTLAASITIVPHWPTASGLPDLNHPLPDAVDFTAAVAVGVHISIAWVVNVDFDGSWAFSQDIKLHLPSGIL
jgi:hypothetical protein